MAKIISTDRKFVFPIYNGETIIGQGFVADNFFITAAHLIQYYPLCYAFLNGKRFELSREKPVFIGEGDICHDPTMMDVIMYHCYEIDSPWHISDFIVQKGDELVMYNKTICNTNSFVKTVSETAYVTGEEDGNYFYCNIKYISGRNGSPLLRGDKVVGMLHGGNNECTCSFLKTGFLLRVIDDILDTNAEKEDNNSWMDEFGVKYSKDGKRLLKASIELKDYSIKKGTLVICDSAFESCSQLLSIKIPDSIMAIGAFAFWDCENLQSIYIPSKVKSIGRGVLGFCPNLKSIIVDNENENYDSRNDCNAIIEKDTNTLIAGCSISHIEESVVIIGGFAFRGCNNLESIYIPSSVKKVRSCAFGFCSLTSIIVDEKNRYLDSRNTCNAIIEKSNNKLVLGCNSSIIPDNVIEIGNFAFYGCGELKSIVIPDNVISIGDSAFKYCENLSSIYLPESITSIGTDVFDECKKLVKIQIPIRTIIKFETLLPLYKDIIKEETAEVAKRELGVYDSYGVKYFNSRLIESAKFKKEHSFIDDYIEAFDVVDRYTGYYHLNKPELNRESFHRILDVIEHKKKIRYSTKEYSILKGTRIICDFAFDDCDGLTSVNMPESLILIGYASFSGCSGLTSINIPYRVKMIDGKAFNGCNSLSVITVDGRNIHYDSRNNCNAIIETKSNTLIVGGSSTIIPNDVLRIADDAFNGRSSLTAIEIPQNVEEIGKSAFSFCPNLSSITVEKSNSFYDSRNNCNAIIETKSNILITGCKTTIIPEDIVKIGNCAFEGCDLLISITIPKGIMEIGKRAFEKCINLVDIIMSKGVTSIGSSAFWGCKRLLSISLPDSISTLGDDVFHYCKNLSFIVFSNGLTKIGKDIFEECDFLTTIQIPTGTKAYFKKIIQQKYWHLLLEQNEIYSYPTKVSDWDLNNAWTDDKGVKYSKDKRKLLKVPREMTEYTIRNGTFFIGDKAFASGIFSHSYINSVIIPNSVIKISKDSFKGCKQLTNIYIPNGTRNKFEKILPDYKGILVER